jgi:hypothetical protein
MFLDVAAVHVVQMAVVQEIELHCLPAKRTPNAPVFDCPFLTAV